MKAETRTMHETLKRIVSLRDDVTGADEAFTTYMLETLSERGAIENGIAVTTRLQTPAIRCDGYGISNSGDVVYLIASQYADEDRAQPIDRGTLGELTKGLVNYCQFLISGRAAQLEEGSEQRDAGLAIQAAMSNHARLRCIMLTNRVATISPRTITTSDGTSVTVEVWGLDQISATLVSESRPDEIEVSIEKMLGRPLACLHAPTSDDSMRVFTAILPGSLVADLYERYNQRILETNVRSFLRQTTKTNRGLRRSIREEPKRFMAYNNGIVLTASAADIAVGMDGSASLKSLTGIQIVNGGQTTASLYMARATDRCDLSNVAVAAKIVVIDGSENLETVRAISTFANTQNAVKQPDLSSGDALMRKIEILSRNTSAPDGKKWFFERTSGQYGVQAFFASTVGKESEKLFLNDFPKDRRFGKVDIAAWQHLWAGLPHEVSKGGQSNFDNWMRNAGDNLPQMDEQAFKDSVAAGIVMNAVKRVVREEKFPAYGAQIANYVVAYLVRATAESFHLDRVWARQSVSDELAATARNLARWVNLRIREYAGEANVTQATKQGKLWEWLASVDSGIDFTSLPETRVPTSAEEAKALMVHG